MTLSELVDAISASTGLARGRVYMHARRLQEIGLAPVGQGGRNAPECDIGHVVLTLFALMSGLPVHHAAHAAIEFCELENDGAQALGYVTGMLESVAKVDKLDLTDVPEDLLLAFKSTITFTSQPEPRMIVRYTCSDKPLEVAFTRDGEPYAPENVEEITESRSIPGTLLFRLGRAIRHVSK